MAFFGSAAQKLEPTPVEASPAKDLSQAISSGTQLVIKQKRELAELFLGFETRNQYLVFDQNGAPCGSIAEQGTSTPKFLTQLPGDESWTCFLRTWRSIGLCLG